MGRPATGAPRWNPRTSTWDARISVNGVREPSPMPGVPACLVVPNAPPASCACASCALARQVAKRVSDKTRKAGMVLEHTEETANEWFERYVEIHGKLGNGIAQHAGDWDRWCSSQIGTKPMATIGIDDVKVIRDSLTRARLDGKIGAKRALNVWSTVVKAPFSRAWTDDDPKYSSVHVGPFAANPATGIKPPVSVSDRADDERERQALEPSEATALLSCESIPVETRRFYAWALFTGLRPAELYGLTWGDIRERVIKVQRSRDMKTAEDTTTKTKASVRDVPIHPHLAPLVKAMRSAGRVFPIERVRDVEQHARELRAHLTTAGVTREELHEGTATLRAFDVRSFRTTFATWCARSGFDSAWIDTWLGHAPKSTAAKHYIKATGALASGVFPALPPCLGEGFGLVLGFWSSCLNDSESLECEGRDLKPAFGPSKNVGRKRTVAGENKPRSDRRRLERSDGFGRERTPKTETIRP